MTRFSDVLFYLFGYLAFLFPVIISYSGWLVFRGTQEDGEINYRVLALRWSGFLVTLAAGCALSSLHFLLQPEIMPLDAGGILGRWLGDELAGMFGLLGSSLLLLALFLAGITLFSGSRAWIGVMDMTGSGILNFYEWVVSKIQQRIVYR